MRIGFSWRLVWNMRELFGELVGRRIYQINSESGRNSVLVNFEMTVWLDEDDLIYLEQNFSGFP